MSIASEIEHVEGGIDYFDDLPPEVQEPATLELLVSLAKLQIELQREIAADEVLLAEKQEKFKKLERERIPEIMEALGMEDFTLTDGSVVEVKKSISASISEANKPVAFKWLEDHNFDGIIKTDVSVQFGKGESEEAKKAMEKLKEAGFYNASLGRSIHPQTLKSFVKEQLEAGTTEQGDSIPIDVFGVFEFKQAKIKLPKAKK